MDGAWCDPVSVCTKTAQLLNAHKAEFTKCAAGIKPSGDGYLKHTPTEIEHDINKAKKRAECTTGRCPTSEEVKLRHVPGLARLF